MLDRPVMDLGRAEQQMVEIAKAFRTRLSVLILDEPTASLTERETERLFALVDQAKAGGVSVVYVTHRTNEIRRLGDRITVLRDGRRIGTLDVADASDERLITMMTGRPFAGLFPEVRHQPGRIVLETEGLTTASGSVRDAAITVRAGEIVGVAGLIGSGKSELARACFGIERLARGRVRFEGADVTGQGPRQMLNRGFCYVPPDRREEGLVMDRDVVENVTLPALRLPEFSYIGLLRRRRERSRVGALAGRMNLRPLDLDRSVGQFSGGNQQKILLAKALTREVRLFAFDEPTVGVDVATRFAIYRFIAELCEVGAAVLLVSSELPEILHLARRVYVMFRGELRAELVGEAITETNVIRRFFERSAA
jgi:ribose transport system ATP-binding protein